MILSTEIQIERGSSFFTVTLIRSSLRLGYYENPETGEETKYLLTEREQDDAYAKMNPEDDISDEGKSTHTARESDDAANAYAGYIGRQADRRNR